MISSQRLVLSLGYAGLLPFVLPALLLLGGSAHAPLAAAIAEVYAFGIVTFLTGTWWGLALETGRRGPILLSNGMFLLALALFFLLPQWWAFAAAALLVALFFIEINPGLFPAFPRGYRRMRAALTLVASLSMFAVHLLR